MLLDYACDPPSVPRSGPSILSNITLNLCVSNPGPKDVRCGWLEFSFPYAMGDETGDAALCQDPTSVTGAPAATTPWAVAGRDGRYRAVPLPPATGVPANGAVTFVFAGIVVPRAGRSARIAITEVTLDAAGQPTVRAEGSVTVAKGPPPAGGGAPAPEVSLTEAPRDHDEPRLAWEARRADAVVLETPDGTVELPAASGSLAVPPGTYTARALGIGGTAASTVTLGGRPPPTA
jgi:hypothetical protein